MPQPRIPLKCPRCDGIYHVLKHNQIKKKTPFCKGCATATRNIANTKHGLEKHPLYQTWVNVLRRIDRPEDSHKNRGYANLDIDPEWRNIRAFVGWAVMSGWEKGLSIERRDNARGYWPDNCHWIPKEHQARNKSNNTIDPALARTIQIRVARGEVRYQVAKDVAAAEGIPLSTVAKVAYGYNWKAST